MTTVHVATSQPYDVVIGRGASADLPALVGDAARVAIIYQAPLAEDAQRLASTLGASKVTLVEVPTGEQAKTSTVLAHCWDSLADAGFTRSDLVVGVGGGTTTDLAGFVAATWLRGVHYISVPTSVLAMVDAAVGGKTGINIDAGKNLVGAFYEPIGVLCDLQLLDSLPAAEIVAGLGEVIKAGFTHDPRILDLVEQDPADALDVTGERFAELITRGIAYKAEVVSHDLREKTSTPGHIGREALNYGHTLAHAIEAHHHFTWRHGEAVSVGMVFAAEVAHRLLGLPAEDVARHRHTLGLVGLPTTYDAAPFGELRPIMSRDKKTRGTTLRMIGLRHLQDLALMEGPDEDVLAESFAALAPGH